MISIEKFTFGPFQENTYVLYDETKECIIVDPGCFDEQERTTLATFIEENGLKPVQLVNTHCHIDHIAGNGFVAEKYKVPLVFNKTDQRIFDAYLATANLYGLNVEPSPDPAGYIDEGDTITFGNSTLEILFTPGHSPGSTGNRGIRRRVCAVLRRSRYGSSPGPAPACPRAAPG